MNIYKIFLSLFIISISSIATADEFDPCSLLQEQEQRALLSGAFEIKLMKRCGEITSEEKQQHQAGVQSGVSLQALAAAVGPATDILVNDPELDEGGTTQSETSVAVSPVDGTICAAWNDSGERAGANGFSGFGVSTDGGSTFTDQGPFPDGPGPDTNSGDPSLAYSAEDDAFYYSALSSLGLSLWVSNDSCQNFT